MNIPFNKPHLTGKETEYMIEAVNRGKLSGNGEYTKRCQAFFEQRYGYKKCLLTTSGTDALEMCAMLCDLQPGDEVIVPSYTFVSTALAFLREGAKVVFADSGKNNPNIDPELIESLITPRTKVIAPVHYAGIACDMDAIMDIANRHNLLVVEDAAQALDSYYKPKPLSSVSFPHNGQGEVADEENFYGRKAYQTADPLKYDLLRENAQRLRNNPTEAEAAIWKYLREEQCGAKFRRQHIIDDFIADFACLELGLIIEIDGGYHNVAEQKEADNARDAVLNHYGFKTLRFTNSAVLSDTDNVVAQIKYAINLQHRMVAHHGETNGRGCALGSIGHLAAISFHETKNITAGGEGGLLILNDERFIRRAEILWEKGTNRAEFFRGEVNKYGWVDMGSSFLPAEINAAFLWAQLEHLDEIQDKRKQLWNRYWELLKPLADKGYFELPKNNDGSLIEPLPIMGETGEGAWETNGSGCNAHMFYLVFPDLEKRTKFIAHLKEAGILSVFHYLSLHKSAYYTRLIEREGISLAHYGEREGDRGYLPECDRYADCLVRLPMFYDLTIAQVEEICGVIKEIYGERL